LTIVAQGNNWWIESFVVTAAAIADQAARTTTFTLERPGIYLGAALTEFHNASIANSGGISTIFRNTANLQMFIGDFVTQVRTVVINDTGAALTIGETVTVFLRKRG